MKTRNLIAGLLAAVMLLCVGCSGNGTTTGGNDIPGNTGDNAGNGEYISAKPLDISRLGDGYNPNYMPDAASIKQRSGTIHVVLDFDGTQVGWQKVAEEYERLHSGKVDVVINTDYSGTMYGEKIISELQNTKTDWDIVQGNLGSYHTNAACMHISSISDQNNEYCGANVKWNDVLENIAFESIENHSTDTYIINSETMQTCWFVNKTALDEAAALGYRNSDGEAATPNTWDDLMSLCAYMQQAGYNNPLGITLSEGSIRTAQFSWLTRIYGDYYYRQYYPYVMNSEYWDDYDPEDTAPETVDGYGVKFCKIANLMLDKNSTLTDDGFVGVGSDIYKDYLSNFYKMRDYIIADASATEFAALRDQFRLQSKGKKSAQIILDYVGYGCLYSTSDAIELDYFDYPVMESDYVDSDTLTRDIGGNGGFLSIVKHVGDKAQNELNIDFMKFFMSPYGQTIYYQGLAEGNVAPAGQTTVKHVVMPQQWSAFYNKVGKKVEFNGNVDGNIFISWGVRFFGDYENTDDMIGEIWKKLLLRGIGAKDEITVDEFCANWYDACFKDYKLKCIDCQWPENMYLNPALPY